MIFRTILIVFVAIAICWAESSSDAKDADFRKRYGICNSQADCSSDECCVISGVRYSYPTCQPLRREGENCRPTPVVSSAQIRFPDNSVFDFTEAHLHLCPCAKNLKCESQEAGDMTQCTAGLSPNGNSVDAE